MRLSQVHAAIDMILASNSSPSAGLSDTRCEGLLESSEPLGSRGVVPFPSVTEVASISFVSDNTTG